MLEYGSTVFDNCTAHESHKLEQIQRRAAIICTGAYRRTSYQSLLSELSWETLESRRHKAKLILLFKINNNLTPSYLKDLIPPLVQETTTYNLRNRSQFRLPQTRTSYRQQSFIPATLRMWNSLDPALKQCKTLTSFKSKLKFQPNPMSLLYSLPLSPLTRFLTRIRLNFSDLHIDLFTHGLIDDPQCTQCNTHQPETSMHYFLECPTYTAHRGAMRRDLRELLTPEENKDNTRLLNLLILGSETNSLAYNIRIFKIVLDYIAKTKRFLKY